MEFSERQKEIIESRGQNLLVSAGAGSGKTTTMVEHIIGLVVNDNISIEDMLIVTFTSAAASEMKQKIANAIQARLDTDGENDFLRTQIRAVEKAQISTIDSFCSKVVKNNFHKVDLDPNYKILNSGIAAQIKERAINDVLEEGFASGDKALGLLCASFSNNGTDSSFVDAVYKLYDYSMSIPFPKKWLEGIYENYDENASMLLNIAKKEAKKLEQRVYISYKAYYDDLCRRFGVSEVEDGVIALINNDLDKMQMGEADFIAANKTPYNKERSLPIDKDYRTEILEKRKGYIERYKKAVENADLTFEPKEEKIIKEYVKTLCEYTVKFHEKYKEYKNKEFYAEFADVEQATLSVFYNEDGTITPEAEEYAAKFKKIIVDEYQDTNYLQEMIFSAITSENNFFMVGDVKQSIYKFRQAEPEIFVNKYNAFSLEKKALDRLIILSENYRSRKEVIDSANHVFSKIMTEKTGGIEYNDDVKLVLGAKYPLSLSDNRTELDIIITDGEDNDVANIDTAAREGAFIAKKIKELFETDFQVYDHGIKGYRKITYDDIAIIFRSPKAYINDVIQQLSLEGIPCVSSTDASLFECIEVKILASALKITDNPLRDIDLVNVIHCGRFDFTADELVDISLNAEGEYFYLKLKDYTQKYNNAVSVKIDNFFSVYKSIRDYAKVSNLSMLTEFISRKLDLYNIFGMYAGGTLRRKNLRLFSQLAREYQNNESCTLQGFIKFFEASAVDNRLTRASFDAEGGNVVKIMTVHSSKGLEYPVVFYGMLGKNFNFTDIKDSMLINKEYGICMNVNVKKSILVGNECNPDFFVKLKPVVRNTFASAMKNNIIAEEIRLMYVAMTRAKEKLFLIGSATEAQTEKYGNSDPIGEEELLNAKSALELILLAGKDKSIVSHIMPKHTIIPKTDKDGVSFHTETMEVDNELISAIDERIHLIRETKPSYVPTVTNITEIKRETAEYMGLPVEQTIYFTNKPKFIIKSSSELTNAKVGTLYHAVFEQLDINTESVEQVQDLINGLYQRGVFNKIESEAVKAEVIYKFLTSPLAQRIRRSPKVRREADFLLNVPVNEAKPMHFTENEGNVMIRGIIDLYFVENDEIVLVDYKTDFFKKEDELIEKYALQMGYYIRALEKAENKKVKECILYAVYKGKCINVPI